MWPRTYSQPSTYGETLKITDHQGHTDYDLETLNVLDAQDPERIPPSTQSTTDQLRAFCRLRAAVHGFGTNLGKSAYTRS